MLKWWFLKLTITLWPCYRVYTNVGPGRLGPPIKIPLWLLCDVESVLTVPTELKRTSEVTSLKVFMWSIMWRELSALTIKVLTRRNAKSMPFFVHSICHLLPLSRFEHYGGPCTATTGIHVCTTHDTPSKPSASLAKQRCSYYSTRYALNKVELDRFQNGLPLIGYIM